MLSRSIQCNMPDRVNIIVIFDLHVRWPNVLHEWNPLCEKDCGQDDCQHSAIAFVDDVLSIAFDHNNYKNGITERTSYH